MLNVQYIESLNLELLIDQYDTILIHYCFRIMVRSQWLIYESLVFMQTHKAQ